MILKKFQLAGRLFYPKYCGAASLKLKMSASTFIEVERKFSIPSTIESSLEKQGGKLLGEKAFRDIYYDTPQYHLTSADHWLRKRTANNSQWELKCPPDHHKDLGSLSTQYAEYTKETDILTRIRNILPEVNLGVENVEMLLEKSLIEIAAFKTIRKSYTLGDYLIDLDVTDFGFNVGEIEKVVSKPEDVPDALFGIDNIAKKLGLQSGQQRIGGKLNAYAALHNHKLYEIMQKHLQLQ